MSTALPPVPASLLSTASVLLRSQRSRQSARQRRAPRSRTRGSTRWSFSAATASRARSCRPRRCWRAIRIRRMPTLTEPLRVAFAGDGYLPADGFLQFTIEDYPVRLVALDTLIPGEGGGLLCSARLAWLDHVLASAPARPVLLMMHHPPFLTGIERMDRAGLQNSAAFAAVVARHPQVERILCGHLHRAIDRRFAGTVAGTGPSTAHQLRLDLTAEAPLRFMFEPPGYQLHLWEAESGLVTHTAVLDEWPGPAPSSPGL